MKRCYHCMCQIENENVCFCSECGHSLDIHPVSTKYLHPGTVLQEKFVVGYPLGSGGFGNTYIGWNQALSCKVAIKEFYPEQYCSRAADRTTVIVLDDKAQERFRKDRQEFLEEARNVAALQDIPGVVEISNSFEENETGYIVMEYLEGMDVKSILDRAGGKMDYEWCRKVTLTILDTLREIHKRGLLHRDIAPDNIIVTNDGIIKLIDFGAAKHFSALSSTSRITLKVGYAPIEQYSRGVGQGAYTDLYAVAALFYRMLTGQRPIPANERLEQDGLILPSDMGIQIPEQAEMGMMVCLNVQPQYRLQSADEFMEALDGKDFVPVYEPEWIFSPIEEKLGIWERIARIPIVAWSGICLGCICLMILALIGASRYRNNRAQEALDNGVIVMNDLSGMTEEEAIASIEELENTAQTQGVILNIDFETDGYIFDLDKEKDGTVASQNVKPSAVLYDPEAENQETPEGFQWEKDGTLSGMVSCSFYSSTKLHYSDLRGLNAYAMAQKLGIDPKDEEHFTGTDEATDSSYYDLVGLETQDGFITAKQLKKKKNRWKEIAYEEDRLRIVYSNIPFFYWESLPDFKQKYGTLDQLPPQDTYIWKNESERETSGEKKLLQEVGGMVDAAYCVITSSESGKGPHKWDILKQIQPAGTELDTSRTKLEKPLLHVVGSEFFYGEKTGEQFKKELAESLGENVEVASKGGVIMTQPIVSVTVTNKKGVEVDYFRKQDSVTVTLNLKAVPTPELQPLQTQEAYIGEENTVRESYTGSGYTGGGNAGSGIEDFDIIGGGNADDGDSGDEDINGEDFGDVSEGRDSFNDSDEDYSGHGFSDVGEVTGGSDDEDGSGGDFGDVSEETRFLE